MATLSPTRAATLVPPGTWEVDAARSAVEFDLRHLKVAHVRGRFNGFSGVVSSAHGGFASIAGTIDAASIDTGDPRRDARVRAEDFFDVERHPTILFTGESSPAGAGELLTIHGTLTIKGVSQPVELRTEHAAALGADRNGHARIRARGAVSRRAFELDWDSAFAAGGLVIDDRVGLRLDIVLVRQNTVG